MRFVIMKNFFKKNSERSIIIMDGIESVKNIIVSIFIIYICNVPIMNIIRDIITNFSELK